MNILLVGDIVGAPGRNIFKQLVPRLKSSGEVHTVIANAENAAAGNGITLPLAQELFDAGADAITLGDHVWGQKEFAPLAGSDKRIVRPANLPPGTPGNGTAVIHTNYGDIGIISLLGRVFMNPCDCPFRAADQALKSLPANIPIVVDIHAEATSEKIALGHYLDGRVAALFGTHTHVQTNDAHLLPGGTAYISDVGMTGPSHSVIGREIAPVLKKFLTGMPSRFEVASGPTQLDAALLVLDNQTRKPLSISPVRWSLPD